MPRDAAGPASKGYCLDRAAIGAVGYTTGVVVPPRDAAGFAAVRRDTAAIGAVGYLACVVPPRDAAVALAAGYRAAVGAVGNCTAGNCTAGNCTADNSRNAAGGAIV